MLNGQRVVVVMPAYRAERTLQATFSAIPRDVIDEILLIDDFSDDGTVSLARSLGISTIVHHQNRGYGANQKTCYEEALRRGAEVVVMLHPDYQYEPRLVTAMASMVASHVYDIVLGSRILGGKARGAGMPAWRYFSNRVLTLVQNIALGSKLSEFHTGFRAFSRKALLALPLLGNSDDFVFDNEVLVQAVAAGLPIGEISCPTSYHENASSISFAKSIRYGLGVLGNSCAYLSWRIGLARPRLLRGEEHDYLSHRLAAFEAATTSTASTAGR